jgi:O-methyltransferase domain/Dimerisation domain
MAAGYWLSQAVYATAKLGVADVLKAGPKSCDEIALATGADGHMLRRLLRVLAMLGLFRPVNSDRYAVTRLGKSLQSDAPGSLRAMVLSLGELHYEAWGHFLQSVRTGTSAFPSTFGSSLFDYLAGNPEAGDTFNRAMTDYSSLVSHAVLLAYDFSDVRSIVDVGGGRGALLTSILGMYEGIEATLFDLPAVIAGAERELASSSEAGRYMLVSGSFLEQVPPGAEVYVMSGVIHDWDDESATRILANCRRAMAPSGRVLVIECVVPDGTEASFSKLLDLNMLVMNGGRERTTAEFRALFTAAGLRLTRVIPTLSPLSLIEGIRGAPADQANPTARSPDRYRS